MSGEIKEVSGVRAAKVLLGDDHILKVEIDLNCDSGMEVEGRVGAYGTLEWAKEIVSRFFTFQEMKKARKLAEDAEKQKAAGIIPLASFKGVKAG